jgi:hypothetical protein
MSGFFTWPLWLVIVSCFLVTAVPPIFQWWFIYRSPFHERIAGFMGVEPAIIGAVGLLFGLFAAFLANDIWARNQIAENAVTQEADAIRTLARYAEGMSQKSNETMRAALVDYAQTVIDKDWPKMTEGSRSKELLSKVRVISGHIITGEIGREAGPAIQGRMIDAFTQMRDNRQTRVQMAENRKLTIKWYALLVFGLLTQFAIAVVHINRPRAHALAQFVFGLAFASCLGILVTNEFPFSPMNPISSEPLQKAMESLFRK